MNKSWSILAALSLVGCSGSGLSPARGGVGRAELHQAPRFAPMPVRRIDPVAASQTFLQQQETMLGLDGHAQFKLIREEATQDGNNHVRLQQTYDGVKVWGSDVVVHSNGEAVTGLNGRLLGSLQQLVLTPTLSAQEALTIAKSGYAARAFAPTAVGYSDEATELVIYPTENGGAQLAWHVTFRTDNKGGALGRWNDFVDAHNGSIINHFNNIQTAVVQASGPGGNPRVAHMFKMELDVEDSGGSYVMNTDRYETGSNTTGQDYQGSDLNNFNADAPEGNNAHGFAEATIKMLKEWQGYDSIDNKGWKLVSHVHNNANGASNAFWDGRSMNYGDGDQRQFYNFTSELDVVAHEIGHGFTEHHSNLTYQGQSGGMNESFSDIQGTAAKFFFEPDRASFILGGDLFVQAGKAFRYMCDPTKDGQSIDNAANFNNQDVHLTSGVMNKAFCRSAKRIAGADPDTGEATPESVKRASAAFYEANAAHWTASTNWKSGCQGVIDAATALKFSPGEISALGDSWKDVGVTCTYTHVDDDFTLSLTPDKQTAMAGTTAKFQIVTAVAAGSTQKQALMLTVDGLPTGVTGTISPTTVQSGDKADLTIDLPASTQEGDITVTVTAAGTATKMASATLTVTAPPPPDMSSPGPGGSDGGSNGTPPGEPKGPGQSPGPGTGHWEGCSMGGSGGSASGAFLLFALVALLSSRRRLFR